MPIKIREIGKQPKIVRGEGMQSPLSMTPFPALTRRAETNPVQEPNGKREGGSR